MTIYNQVDIGTVDDDGTGDTLRVAFGKVNDNLTLQDTAITLDEVASHAAPGAAKGKIWVRNDTPNVLMFTDDAGTEIELGAGGGGGGGGSPPDIFEFTASAGQAIFTGVDDNTNTLAYTSGQIIVYLNGGALDSSDYTATNGSDITLLTAADLNDILLVTAYNAGTTISDAPSDGNPYGRQDGAWADLTSFLIGIISPLTTKGDLFTYDTNNQRLAIGTDTFVLTADAAEPTGMKWAVGASALEVQDEGISLSVATTKLNFVGGGVIVTEPVADEMLITIGSPLTTKGDLFTYDTADQRLAIGTDTFVLTADAAAPTGMTWAAAAGGGIGTETAQNDILIGTGAGINLNPSFSGTNILVGVNAGKSITNGDDNVVIGYNAMAQTPTAATGRSNIAIGSRALNGSSITSANNNVGIGVQALDGISTGQHNVAIGTDAGNITSGINNVTIGSAAGFNITTGSSNVMLGYNAGPTVNESNGLFIHNSQSNTPLIGGNFSTGIVKFGGALRFTERAARIETPTGTFGELWVRSDTPNVLVFTDDAGTDTVLGGGGGGSALEVEDNGISLSTAVTKFNFIGFNVTEPVADEIEISFGVSAASNEYCPGYTSYTRVTDSQFTIDLIDAKNLFYVGRRVKFDLAGVFDYGVINAVDFNSTNVNDTTVTLTMEGTDTIPVGVFDVCLVSSATAWSPIAGDPFSGGPINAIETGIIGATQWWVACGNGGKVATSNDGGATWTLRTTTTVEHLNDIAYDSTNEAFWIGGNAGVLLDTTNGTTFTEDTTSIPALAGASTYDIYSFIYSSSEDALVLQYQTTATESYTAATLNQGTLWTRYAPLADPVKGPGGMSPNYTADTVTGPLNWSILTSSVNISQVTSYNDATWIPTIAGGGTNLVSVITFFDTNNVILVGNVSNGIFAVAGTGWSGDDTTTFSNATRDFAWSKAHDRVVGVGDNGQIGYWDAANGGVANSWVSIANGFAPTANVTSVAWNVTDAVFCAVANNGQICRSSNGTN